MGSCPNFDRADPRPLLPLRIDHVKAPKEGGADEPGQAGEDANAEDQWEYRAGRTKKERS